MNSLEKTAKRLIASIIICGGRQIFKGTLTNKYEIHVLKPVLSEVFYHLCIQKGAHYAKSRILSIKQLYPIVQISLDDDLINRTGQLKCQNRKNLSYIDCMSISYCMLNKIQFHTTEKKIKRQDYHQDI